MNTKEFPFWLFKKDHTPIKAGDRWRNVSIQNMGLKGSENTIQATVDIAYMKYMQSKRIHQRMTTNSKLHKIRIWNDLICTLRNICLLKPWFMPLKNVHL